MQAWLTPSHREGGLVVRKAILGLTCFIALQLAAVVAHAQSTVKIGLIMTYTGQFTDAAAQMDNGIKLYMKQNSDTISGKKIEAFLQLADEVLE